MRWLLSCAALVLTPVAAFAEPDTDSIVNGHVMPGVRALSVAATQLSRAAENDCAADSPSLRTAYHEAFDAWISVSHLRFGPSEQEDRAFALAFWPDTRGKTPKALAGLLASEDAAVLSLRDFAEVSIAARGFYALEFLLYDPAYSEGDAYHCALVRAVSGDIARIADEILIDWEGGFASAMINPDGAPYKTQAEVAQQFFTSLTTSLEFTSDVRLGRPLGTFDRPRPKRAEAWRSGRSLRHVVLSLQANQDLARYLSDGDEGVDTAFQRAIAAATELNDPIFANVDDPTGRFRVEVLKQVVDSLRDTIAQDLGPALGIAAGFNAMDGD